MGVAIWKQGYQYSENGWPMVDQHELDYSKIPGMNFALGVRIGVPNTLLKALAWRLDKIQPLDATQCGCYTDTNEMANSNHNSATALDFNWRKHPWHAQNTWGSLKPGVDKIVADFRGTIEWGGYWDLSYLDEMHFELHFGPGHQGSIDLANELYQGGLWGIFKPGAPPAPVGTPTPIPVGPTATFWLGIGSANATVLSLQKQANVIFRSYSHLTEDGIYGPNTAAFVAEFQRRATAFKLVIDGEVGPLTKAALATYGVKL